MGLELTIWAHSKRSRNGFQYTPEDVSYAFGKKEMRSAKGVRNKNLAKQRLGLYDQRNG